MILRRWEHGLQIGVDLMTDPDEDGNSQRVERFAGGPGPDVPYEWTYRIRTAAGTRDVTSTAAPADFETQLPPGETVARIMAQTIDATRTDAWFAAVEDEINELLGARIEAAGLEA